MTFGNESDEKSAHAQLDLFAEAGGTFVDTADADSRGVSMAEVALAWVTDRPGVTATILGARTVDQLQADLRAADLHLSAEETAALDAASDPHPTDYPYGPLGLDQRSRTF
jgi:aryl-alcohol dehydrogenase (NADP+)